MRKRQVLRYWGLALQSWGVQVAAAGGPSPHRSLPLGVSRRDAPGGGNGHLPQEQSASVGGGEKHEATKGRE